MCGMTCHKKCLGQLKVKCGTHQVNLHDRSMGLACHCVVREGRVGRAPHNGLYRGTLPKRNTVSSMRVYRSMWVFMEHVH